MRRILRIVAGQVGFAGHISVADGSIFGAQTGIPNTIKNPGGVYQGYPAIPVNIFRRASVVYKNLPDLQHTSLYAWRFGLSANYLAVSLRCQHI